jgi:hypothetical protein
MANSSVAAQAKYPKAWKEVKFNPPMHRGAMGAYLDDNGGMDTTSKDPYGHRSQIMGPDGANLRRNRKGVMFQHTQYPKEWVETGVNGARKTVTDQNRYGFRFHYNPSTIEHGMGLNDVAINTSLIMSGLDQSMPITTDNMPTVRFQLFLNRIEDMMLITPAENKAAEERAYKKAHNAWKSRLAALQKTNFQAYLREIQREPKRAEYVTTNSGLVVPDDATMRYFYGRTLTEKEITGIYSRGTLYDLEFLFRALLGKPWDTLLRGKTADVGVAFGVPMVLDFNAGVNPGEISHGQRYLGRVSEISYAHLSFNERMVPMWTSVSLLFVRYPDAKNDGSVTAINTWSDSASPIGPTSADNAQRVLVDGGLGVTNADAPIVYFGGTPTNPGGYSEPIDYYGGTPTNPAGYLDNNDYAHNNPDFTPMPY